MTTTRINHSTYCPTLGGGGDCLGCGASTINSRTFRGFVHDIRTGDIVNIKGIPCQVERITHSTNHSTNNLRPTTLLVGIDNLGVARTDVLYTDQLVGITR